MTYTFQKNVFDTIINALENDVVYFVFDLTSGESKTVSELKAQIAMVYPDMVFA